MFSKTQNIRCLKCFMGFCKNITWKKNILLVALYGCQSLYRDTRIHVYIFFLLPTFCRSKFNRYTSWLYIYAEVFAYICVQSTHTPHMGSCYTRRVPHSYNAFRRQLLLRTTKQITVF